jgi:hypothetical protein
MKKIILLTIVTISFLACKVKRYEAADFKQRTATHKMVAILPPAISYTSPTAGTLTIFKDKEQQIKNESNALHYHIYNRVLRESNKKNPVNIAFQDIAKTNSLLQAAGIGQKELKEKSSEELAKILGVDAVMVNKVEKMLLVDDKLLALYGVGKDVVNAVLGNIPSAPTPGTAGMVKLGEMKMSSTINDAKDGYMLWRGYKTFDITLDDLPEDVSTRYGNQCARSFPYRAK